MNAAIATTIQQLFQNYDEDSFSAACENYVFNFCNCPVSESNRRSWKDCFLFLKSNINRPEFQNYPIIFEYLMVDSCQRPDVLILTESKVIVLEFKEKCEVKKDDVTQASGYKTSFVNFHYETANMGLNVESYLVYTKEMNQPCPIPYFDPRTFRSGLNNILDKPMDPKQFQTWLNSPFEPLKNIADATMQLFKTHKLPNIKTIKDGDIQECLDTIDEIIQNPAPHKIVFIEGVPGAGKTLVGLKTVFDQSAKNPALNPVYLSGNGPLVNILQQTLTRGGANGEAFIRDMYKFKQNINTQNHVIIFDEAQRAWDANKNRGISEPEALLSKLEYVPNITLICLIGSGQSIYTGEEVGMPLWADALHKHPNWLAFFPDSMSSLFKGVANNQLFLDTSIRNSFINVAPLVEAILDCHFQEARDIYQDLATQGLQVYLKYNKSHLKGIADARFSENISKEYHNHTGLLVSSYVDNQAADMIFPQGYQGNRVRANEAYRWYEYESHLLTRGASEFLIQGIELEWPIVTFGGDFYLENGRWVISPQAQARGRSFRDFNTIIKNIYRVLLTRSRKGMYLYIPCRELPRLKETFDTLYAIFAL